MNIAALLRKFLAGLSLMRRQRVRLKDIAARTGFSTNTVSLALRESPRIPEQTRARIQGIASELNYLPNEIAKSLVSRQSKTIGLVLTDILNPTLNRTAQALEIALKARGYSTLFATSNNRLADEIQVINAFRSRQVDGILVYPASHHDIDHLRNLRNSGYPLVLLVADKDAGVDAVCIDGRSGAFKVTSHLISKGHKRIGLVDAGYLLGNMEKQQGYLDALSAHRMKVDDGLMVRPEGTGVKAGFDAAPGLLGAGDRPSAVLCSNDSLALGVQRWAIANGLAVPGDLAIAGFDNTEFGAYAAVPLTSVDYSAETVSNRAVERLIGLIASADHLPAPEVELIEPDLIVRQSTSGPVAGR